MRQRMLFDDPKPAKKKPKPKKKKIIRIGIKKGKK